QVYRRRPGLLPGTACDNTRKCNDYHGASEPVPGDDAFPHSPLLPVPRRARKPSMGYFRLKSAAAPTTAAALPSVEQLAQRAKHRNVGQIKVNRGDRDL